MEWPLIYDIRARPFKITSPTGTSDLQMVDIGLRVLYRPDPGAIQSIAKNIGEGIFLNLKDLNVLKILLFRFCGKDFAFYYS